MKDEGTNTSQDDSLNSSLTSSGRKPAREEERVLRQRLEREKQGLESTIEELNKKIKGQAADFKRELQEVKSRWARATQKADSDAHALRQKHQDNIEKLERDWRARLDKETKLRLTAQKEASSLSGRLEMQKNVVEDLGRQLAKVKDDYKQAMRRRVEERERHRGCSRSNTPRCAALSPPPSTRTEAGSVMSSCTTLSDEVSWKADENEHDDDDEAAGDDERDGGSHASHFTRQSGHDGGTRTTTTAEGVVEGEAAELVLGELETSVCKLRDLARSKGAEDTSTEQLCGLADGMQELCTSLQAKIQVLVASCAASERNMEQLQKASDQGMHQLNEMLKESATCYWKQRDQLLEVIVGLEETVRQQKEALRRYTRHSLATTSESAPEEEEEEAGKEGDLDYDCEKGGYYEEEGPSDDPGPTESGVAAEQQQEEEEGESGEGLVVAIPAAGALGVEVPSSTSSCTTTGTPGAAAAETPGAATCASTGKSFRTRIKVPTPVSVHRKAGAQRESSTAECMTTPRRVLRSEESGEEEEEGPSSSRTREPRTPLSASKADDSPGSSFHRLKMMSGSASASKIPRGSMA